AHVDPPCLLAWRRREATEGVDRWRRRVEARQALGRLATLEIGLQSALLDLLRQRSSSQRRRDRGVKLLRVGGEGRVADIVDGLELGVELGDGDRDAVELSRAGVQSSLRIGPLRPCGLRQLRGARQAIELGDALAVSIQERGYQALAFDCPRGEVDLPYLPSQ